MNDDFEKKLKTLSQHTFDKQTNALDDNILKRLKASRQQAIDSMPPTKQSNSDSNDIFPSWLSSVSTATAFASVALIISSLWLQTDIKTQSLATPLDDIELLSSTDELEFYENLDFYIWVEDEANSSQKNDNNAS